MDIIDYWFCSEPDEFKKWWFQINMSKDKEIYELFYNQLINFEINKNPEPRNLVNQILLLDQVSRNINRIITINVDNYTVTAEDLSNIYINNKLYLSQPFGYTAFVLLPFRHNKNISMVLRTKEILEQIKDKYKNNVLYNKFLNATNKFISLN
jgi:uncharacterized protein (DUF924 family)